MGPCGLRMYTDPLPLKFSIRATVGRAPVAYMTGNQASAGQTSRSQTAALSPLQVPLPTPKTEPQIGEVGSPALEII